MKDETSLFGVPPERVDRLLRYGLMPPEGNGETAAAPALDRFGEKPGGRIDRYQLLRVLGEGGMGIVYLAQQDEPVKRQVALKVIKPGMDSKRVLARFEAEKQALALMDHPHIARVIDAGLTLSARPYFVMEYVKGLPITEFCDHHKLMIEERLRLFLQICHAVHHAHQKGIIHRDIKPSNILVTDQDGQTIPKIIDFGIAKALTGSLTEDTLSTEQGQLFGTPEYMSPEQADLSTEDIDTRSDIYSLGVLLYVLLAGVLPFDSDTLREGGVEHIRRIIRETDLKTPSTRLKNLGQEAKKIAESRRTELVVLTKRLHKELEWIPLKAMREERSERYRSASELADDIENYLKGNPLIAGPLTTVYRLKKFMRRNRTLVIGSATILVVLIVGIVVSMLFALGQARARAEAQAVSDFLRNTVLASLDPYAVGGMAITNRSALDAISEGIEGKLTEYPLAQAEIRERLGFAYWSLGAYKLSESHYRHAIEIYRTYLGNEHPTTLSLMKQLGWVYHYASRYDEAVQLFAEALQGMQVVLGEENENTLHTVASLGSVYYMQGRFKEAEKLCSTALETMQRNLGEKNRPLVDVICMQAVGYRFQGRYDEAEQLFNRGLTISRRELGEQHWSTLMLMQTFGQLCCDLGRYDEAEQLLLKDLEGRSNAWGQEHPDTLWTMGCLGWLYYSQGRYEEAESMFVEALEAARQVFGEAHTCSLHAMYGLGILRLSQGLHDWAEELLLKVLEIAPGVVGEEHWGTLSTNSTLAKLYTAQGWYAKAEKLYLKTLETQLRVLGHEHPHTLTSINGLAVLYTKQKRYDEAERLFHESLEARKLKLGDDHPETLESKNDLAVLYKEQGRYEEAEPLLLEAVEGRRLIFGDQHPFTLESLHNLIDLYDAWNKPEKAKEWRAKLPQPATKVTK